MAPPAEKKKKHSSADHRLIISASIGGKKQQQTLGSVITSFGKRRSLRVAMKENCRILRKIWVCNDIWMDIFPHFDRPQLGLKMALLSPRFNALVDKHFDGISQLTIWNAITIHKIGTKAKLVVEENKAKFPLPDHPLRNKISFNYLRIEYIDHSVITFLRANQQIFDKGTNLDLFVPYYDHDEKNVQPIWDDFAREIWPIFAPNIRHLSVSEGDYLDSLRRHISPTILTDLNQLNSINFEDLLPDLIADDGPNATAGQALSKWLHIPTKDGKPKQLTCYDYSKPPYIKWITNFKEAFLRATTSAASYIIRLEEFEKTEIGPFELMNERTNEVLTLEKEENDDENIEEYDEDDDECGERWVIKRCQIGQAATIQWKEKKMNNLNSVNFHLCKFGPLSPPKAGKMNAKSRQKMNPGPSGQRKKK